MCGRFSQLRIQTQPGIVGAMLEAGVPRPTSSGSERADAPLQPAPTQIANVVRDTPEGLMVDRLRWGLLPFWAKDTKLGYTTINARVETVASKPAFRSAFADRRALIPMAGYFE